MANQDFAGQQAGEEVKFVFRRHPSVMTRSIIVVGVILLITVLPLVLWSKTAPWLWYALAIAVMLVVVIIFRSWLRWYYSVSHRDELAHPPADSTGSVSQNRRGCLLG